MSFTVQFLEQQHPALAVSETNPAAACGVRRIARSHKPQRQAVRIHACPPPPKPPGEAKALIAQVYVPYSGRSVLHKRIHANNLAAIGRTAELQKQTVELIHQSGQLSLQSAILRQQTDAQLAMAEATGDISRQFPGRPAPDFDPGLNDVKFSLIADIVAVAAHLMDKHEVDADSFLNDKLALNTAPLIDNVHERLQGYKLEEALKTFDSAVEEATFERFVASGMLTAPAVYAEINRRAGFLLRTMVLIAAADLGPGIDPEDWPAPPHDDDDGGVPDVVLVDTPAQAAPAKVAVAKAAAPKVTAKTAKKLAPRTRR